MYNEDNFIAMYRDWSFTEFILTLPIIGVCLFLMLTIPAYFILDFDEVHLYIFGGLSIIGMAYLTIGFIWAKIGYSARHWLLVFASFLLGFVIYAIGHF